jgi:hypothetical protein
VSEQEGCIQFDCRWDPRPAFLAAQVEEAVRCRRECTTLGVVGVDMDGIGFGNVSLRFDVEEGFFITGTQTGELECLDGRHFCHVTSFDIEKNMLDCVGPIAPSSEALTHAAIYQQCPNVVAVVHGHHRVFWEHYKSTMRCTSPRATNGTVRLAQEVGELSSGFSQGAECMILSGHQDGFMVYGSDSNEILRYLRKLLDAL